jgi:hypothetical protein
MIVFEVAKIGSPYAVKKYTFSVATLLAFGLAALVSGWLDGRRPRRSWPVLAIGLPPVFALVATVAMPPSTPDRLNRFVAYQKSVRALLRDPRTPRDAFGNTMSMNDDFSPFLNLAFTVVDLGMGQAKGMSAFGITSPQTPGTYVLWKAAGDDLADSCTAAVPGFIPVVLTKVNCGPMSSGELQFAQDMSKVSILPRYFGSGWSVKEPNGVWSDGPKAQIATHFDRPPGSLRMTIKASAYIPKAGYVQHILVSAGGAPLTEWSFDAKEPTGVRQVVIPASQIVDGDLKMDFAFPDAVRPNAPGNPGAARQLGIFLTEISMENLRRLGPGDSIKLGKVFLSPPFLTAGWSEKTQTGTGVWSVGRKSSMLLSINEGDWDPVVVLEGNAFLPTPGYSQRVIVRVGSNVVAQWTLDAKSAGKPLSIAVPRRLAKGGEIALDFEFPDATSPAAHNQPGDSRDLGFFVTSVGLKAATRAPT